MTGRAKIAVAVGGSALGHLLLLTGAIGWIAFGGIPDNDDFSLRLRLGSVKEARVVGSNYAASREDGEPLHAGVSSQSGSVWWSWRPPDEASDVLVEVTLAGGDPLVAVYTGFAVGKLELVAESNKGALSFAPESGTDYHFAVAGVGRDAEGLINLHVQAFADEDSEMPTPAEEPALLLPEIVIEEKKPEQNDRAFVRTSQNDRAAVAPADASFESDRNTVAASELPPDSEGIENVPTQEGVDLPHLEMARREYVDGEIGDDATIPIASVEIFEPQLAEALRGEKIELEPVEELVEEIPAPAAEQLLDKTLLADTGELAAEVLGESPSDEGKKEMEVAAVEPVPERERGDEVKTPDQPPAPAPIPGSEEATDANVFQPQTRRNQVAGTISNRGKSSVDAAETPLGRYTRAVTGAVEKRWHRERRRNADFVSFGSMKVSFEVGTDGKPGKLKILEDKADPIMVDFTLGAILSAEVPEMPEEVRKLLGNEPLKISYEVILY